MDKFNPDEFLRRIRFSLPNDLNVDTHDMINWAKKKFLSLNEVYNGTGGLDNWRKQVIHSGLVFDFKLSENIANINIFKPLPEIPIISPKLAKEEFIKPEPAIIPIKEPKVPFYKPKFKEEETPIKLSEWAFDYYVAIPMIDSLTDTEQSFLFLYKVPEENGEVCINDILNTPDYIIGYFSGEDVYDFHMGDPANVRFEGEGETDPRTERIYFMALPYDEYAQGKDISSTTFQETQSIDGWNLLQPTWDWLIRPPDGFYRYQFGFWYTGSAGGPQPILGDYGRWVWIGPTFFERIKQRDDQRYFHHSRLAWDGTIEFTAKNEWAETETIFKFPCNEYLGDIYIPAMGITMFVGPDWTGASHGEHWASTYPEYDVLWIPYPEDTPRAFRRHAHISMPPYPTEFNDFWATQTVFLMDPKIFGLFGDSWAYPQNKVFTSDYLDSRFGSIFGMNQNKIPHLRTGAQVVNWNNAFWKYKYVYPFADICRMVPEAYADYASIHAGDGSTDETDHKSELPQPVGRYPYAVNCFHHGHPSSFTDYEHGTVTWYTTFMYIKGMFDPWEKFRQGTWDLASVTPAWYYIGVYMEDALAMGRQEDRLFANATALYIDGIGEPVYEHDKKVDKVFWYPHVMVPIIGIRRITRDTQGLSTKINVFDGMEEVK